PEAAVLQTERAAAGARRNFRGLWPPVETERDVAAVAAPGDAHSTLPQSREPTRHPGPIVFPVRTERTPRPGLLAHEDPQVDRDHDRQGVHEQHVDGANVHRIAR